MTHQVEFPKLGLSFTVNETAFSIGSFEVKWYGIIIAVGFLLALIYAARSSKKMNIDFDKLFDAVIVGLIGSVICARLFYVVFYPGDKYWKNPLEILNIHSGGLAIYGGIIGALVFGGIVAKIRKLNVPAVLDLASLGFLIGQGIGRWGNFVNQEAFGTATDLPWGMYSDNTALEVVGNVHPCFLYESILCLLGFVLLHFFTRKYRRYDGQTFLLYIVWYGVCRYFIEGLRTDSLLMHSADFRISQVLAALSAAVAVILLIVFRRRTSLSGCGSRKVMEAVGLVQPEPAEEDDGVSTIFGDLPPEEEQAEQEQEEEESAGKREENPGSDNGGVEKEKEETEEEGAFCMAKLIDGKAVSAKVKAEAAEEVKVLKAGGITPGLAVIIVGDDPASHIYVNNKKKACAATGIHSEEYALPADTTQEELLALVKELNEKEDIHGILVQSPLPDGLDESAVVEAIDPLKDVDAFHAYNVGRIMIGNYRFLPCTPAGVIELIRSTGVEIAGKNCVVIGRSNIVGKPMAMLLLHNNGTVTICHSRTKNLKEICRSADILVSAVGKAHFVTADMVKEGAVVIDVGMNRDENGKLCGDVDFDAVESLASHITPVPGGVGPMTIAMLMKNTVTAAKLQNGIA